MKPSVADQTLIPAKVWRRHTDPPGLWISVFIGSVSLHLLVFWLMRSSNTFILRFPQESQSVITPIQLIDVAPTTKSTSKPQSTAKAVVAPKRLSSTQKSVAVRTTSKNQDFSARNSIDHLQPKSKTDASETNSQRLRQQTVAKTIPTPTATSKPKVPVNNLPWNRRQQLRFGKGTPLTGISTKPPVKQTPQTPTGQTRPNPGQTPQTPTGQTRPNPKQTPQTPTGQTRPNPGQTPQTPAGQTRPNLNQGASIAIVAPLPKDEVSSLIKAGKLRQNALPDAIAVYQGSRTKQFDSSFLTQNSGLQPAELLASLIIDRNGNFQQAVVLEIEPLTLQSQKNRYQQVLNEIFKTENFLAAQNNDGTKPDLSNLYIRIEIQFANSN